MAPGKWRAFRKVLQRKKLFEPDQLEASGLRRCLTRWDLTSLGLGSTLGVGIYVLVGSVALRVAGPSIVLSFLMAAVASMFAGLCYAEFGSRVPKAGSAYIYTYVTVGEFAAFIIGWNMILEAMFGTASVARGLSTYIDSMADGAMSAWFTSVAPISADFFATYFDFLAFAIVLLLGVLLAVGARESSMVNNVFAILNMTVIMFIIIVGSIQADKSNWSIPQADVPTNKGVGGFFPYGIWGTFRGAALCFYGFVGFDAISATGEEVTEPRRTIPQAILTVLCIVLFVYVGVATVVTMMVPYYLLDKVAAVATAFTYVGWDWARWIVSIGAVFGICASLYGCMFPLPRLLYSMAGDGLLLHWFSRVSSSRQTPVVATIVPACVIATLAAVVDLDQLILMMCIGTLLSYTIVATCVVILRYHSKTRKEDRPSLLRQILGLGDRTPTRTTSRVASIALLLYICTCIVAALVGIYTENPLIPVVVLHAIALLLIVVITLQPQVQEDLPFKTPLVPVVPCLSIHINIHLMILVNLQTWIRVIVWILIGIPIYVICLYCYKQNKGNLGMTIKEYQLTKQNGKPPVQIIVQYATPTNTLTRNANISADLSNSGDLTNISGDQATKELQAKDEFDIIQRADELNYAVLVQKTDETIVEEGITENNEEKEAKIIDLLDQVLKAEEDSYVEQISLKDMQAEDESIMVPISDPIPHRKSLSELSDAGSDASCGIQELSKYNVIALVHREDLPKLSEEEEKVKDEKESDNEVKHEPEDLTEVENSETNSRTDESGYSDTLDRNAFNDSIEDTREEAPYIPTPPPLDEKLFNSPYLFKKSYSIPSNRLRERHEEVEENKPRESVQSNSSQDDGNIVFGSSKQMRFMNKLNDIFQTKMTLDPSEEKEKKRSNSTGSIMANPEYDETSWRERPSVLMDLNRELMAKSALNLKPINVDLREENVETKSINDESDEETSLSREDLKSKLESIFASGGPKLLKPRLMKSNPPTPEESYQTDTSSSDSLTKLPKMEKNDTLKRQKDKFGEVLNSFRLSLGKDDIV